MTDDIANRLRNKHADDLLAWEAANEIERLRKERDDARREVCELKLVNAYDYATDRGWDCFKGATDGNA